ncbi:putative ankyrin repeat protein L93 [Diplonema papillatum]|nr:putative ankyrin repeat protein L93 [Diplonema papillatum]
MDLKVKLVNDKILAGSLIPLKCNTELVVSDLLRFIEKNTRIPSKDLILALPSGAEISIARATDTLASHDVRAGDVISVVSTPVLTAILELADMGLVPGSDELLKAVKAGNHKAVDLFLRAGVDVNGRHYTDGWTSLMAAADNGDVKLMTFLVDKGARVNHKKNNGCTALMSAADLGDLASIRFLLDRGALPNDEAKEGWTALMYAAKHGVTQAVAMLLDAGSDVNATSIDGWTATKLAKCGGHAETFSLLRSRKGKIRRKTR